jgi:hypothetical protein
MILVILALRRVTPYIPASWNAFVQEIPPHAIGCFAAFWFIERTVAALA